jgi:competence protein ComEA
VAVTGRERRLSDEPADWLLPRGVRQGPAAPGGGAAIWDESPPDDVGLFAAGDQDVDADAPEPDDLAAALRRAASPATPAGWADGPERGQQVWGFAREHLGVIVVALAVAVVFAVVQATRSRPEAVSAPSVVVQAAGTASAEPSSDMSPVVSSTPATIKVHVLGAVASPGVIELPVGARVDDAIAAAGGMTADADPAELNLAAVVADGSQIIIGTTADPLGAVNGIGTADPAGAAGGAGAAGSAVDLNTATQAQLEVLPGIGPVKAQQILTWRGQHGKFTSVDELQEIDGIGPKTFAQLEPYVTV